LEQLVKDHTQNACQRHHSGRLHGGSTVKQGQGEDQDVPDDAIAQAAGNLEHPPWNRQRRATVQLTADSVLNRIEAGNERIETARFHVSLLRSATSALRAALPTSHGGATPDGHLTPSVHPQHVRSMTEV